MEQKACGYRVPAGFLCELSIIEPMQYAILVHMRSDKGEAFVLRRQGKSYREIATQLGVSKGTLSNWFAGVDFSEAIKQELNKEASKKRVRHVGKLNRVRGAALAVAYERAEEEAKQELHTFRNIPLFISAISLFWAHGYTDGKHQLRLTSADPELLHVFIAFLERFCGLTPSDLGLMIFVHDDQNIQTCERYWMRQTRIKRLHKTQVHKNTRSSKRVSRGTACVISANAVIVRKMNVWIDHLPEMVLNTVPKKERSTANRKK